MPNQTTDEDLTKEEYLALQSELEALERAIAMGQDTNTTDSRLKEIERQMSRAPWTLCPDEGCIPKIEIKTRAVPPGINRLSLILNDIQHEHLIVYGVHNHLVRTVSLGFGDYFEIHYSEDGMDIDKAFFISDEIRLELSADKLKVLSKRFNSEAWSLTKT